MRPQAIVGDRVQQRATGDDGESPRRRQTGAIAKVEERGRDAAEDDAELQPVEEGSLGGEVDFGLDADGDVDAFSLGGFEFAGVDLSADRVDAADASIGGHGGGFRRGGCWVDGAVGGREECRERLGLHGHVEGVGMVFLEWGERIWEGRRAQMATNLG